MPIEIRELIIKVTVADDLNQRRESDIDVRTLKKQIIRECMDKMRDLMDKKVSR